MLRFLDSDKRLWRAVPDDVAAFDFKCVAEARHVARARSAQPNEVRARQEIKNS